MSKEHPIRTLAKARKHLFTEMDSDKIIDALTAQVSRECGCPSKVPTDDGVCPGATDAVVGPSICQACWTVYLLNKALERMGRDEQSGHL